MVSIEVWGPALAQDFNRLSYPFSESDDLPYDANCTGFGTLKMASVITNVHCVTYYLGSVSM